MRELPEEIEQYRDRKWRREDALKIETAEQAEAMVEELGFCLGLTDARKQRFAAGAMPTCRAMFRKIRRRARRGF